MFSRILAKNTACRRLPYDFYNVPGTNDYFFLRYDILNPKDARQYCLSQGMDLPSITTKQQNEIIYCIAFLKLKLFLFMFLINLIFKSFNKKEFRPPRSVSHGRHYN